jgi:hypothetical protein
MLRSGGRAGLAGRPGLAASELGLFAKGIDARTRRFTGNPLLLLRRWKGDGRFSSP